MYQRSVKHKRHDKGIGLDWFINLYVCEGKCNVGKLKKKSTEQETGKTDMKVELRVSTTA